MPMSVTQFSFDEGAQEQSRAQETANRAGLATFTLGNRRYLGGKSKLLEFIDAEMNLALGRIPASVFDVFAGTGVVGNHFANQGVLIMANDLLQHNYYGLLTFLSPEPLDLGRLAEKILHLQSLKPRKNYFSENFSGTYFSDFNAKKIGTIRDEIEVIAGSIREKAALVTSLIYATDRVANTVGHYDAFHRAQNNENPVVLKFPAICEAVKSANQIYCQDSMELAPKVSAEVAYLDPPYNSRQYSDAYHLLENLAAWDKPDVAGIAKKMDRTHLKSQFCGKKAPAAFADLVASLDASLVIISYNNTSGNLNARSNASITDGEIMEVLDSRGTVTVKEIVFNGFTAGKTKKREHRERLFICKVKK